MTHTESLDLDSALGPQQEVRLPGGTVRYRERGAGPTLLFVHGLLVNGALWRKVVPELAPDFRCIAPDWPLGSHEVPLGEAADRTPAGMAQLIADFMAALELDDVTIVANDTGGAVAQSLAGRHPERIGRLVLTSCDAFEKFPPTPQRYLEVTARSRALMWFVGWSVQFRLVQRLPTAYGWVTSRPIEPAIMRSYTEPVRTNPGVRRDLTRLLRAVDTRYTYEAAESLRGFDRPALVLWADGDKIFPREHGRRLAELLPQGRFELVPDSRTFIPEEQPERLAARVRDFVAEHEHQHG